MRKVILNVAVSLDGYLEGPNGEYDWCFADQDYGMADFFGSIDIIFLGRKSYELIRNTGDINAFPQAKLVFSDTLDPQQNPDVTIIRRADVKETVENLLDEYGANIWLFGGADLIHSLLQENLIDEFLLAVHPILLGGGKSLFGQFNNRIHLRHLDTQTYNTGLVQSRYALDK